MTSIYCILTSFGARVVCVYFVQNDVVVGKQPYFSYHSVHVFFFVEEGFSASSFT